MKQTLHLPHNKVRYLIAVFSYLYTATTTTDYQLFTEAFTSLPLQHSSSLYQVSKIHTDSQLWSSKAPTNPKLENNSKSGSTKKNKKSNNRTLKPQKQERRKNDINYSVASKLISDSMHNHEILTREQEQELGEKISEARKLRSRISQYIIDKNVLESTNYEKIELHDCQNDKDWDFDFYTDDVLEIEDYDLSQLTIMSGYENTKRLSSRIKASSTNSKVLDDSIFSIHFDPLLKQDIQELSDKDIISGLALPGGKTELLHILTQGINARRKLISCNIKLVTSISRNWMRRTLSKSESSDGQVSSSNLARIYQLGTWDIPSLDEVIHEGTIGLTKAADKFEAKRGNKFSTYATHWITSYVRRSFTNARTQCLQLPESLHLIKAAHGKIVKRYYELNEPPPSEEVIAAEIGVNVNRLRTALRSTRSLLSIDAPIFNGKRSGKGSSAGGDSVDNSALISDTLMW